MPSFPSAVIIYHLAPRMASVIQPFLQRERESERDKTFHLSNIVLIRQKAMVRDAALLAVFTEKSFCFMIIW